MAEFFSTKTKAGRLRRFLLERIEQHREAGTIPTTTRFLYYEAVSAGVVQKGKGTGGRRSDQDISAALTELRERGDVLDNEIQDRTRRVANYTGYQTVDEGLKSKIDNIRLDPWRQQAPLLMVESESLAGLLEKIAYKYRVPLVPLRGQASRSFIENDIAPLIASGNTRVLYLGDWDKAGRDIATSVQVRTRGITQWLTVALTEDQVEQYDLPRIEKADRRNGTVYPACETEAMPQDILMRLVTDTLNDLLPDGQSLEECRQREQHQRKEVLERINS